MGGNNHYSCDLLGRVTRTKTADGNEIKRFCEGGAGAQPLPAVGLPPSPADEAITDRLIQVGHIVNIKMMDHLVISTDGYYSFAAEGLLRKLEKSTEWLAQFELIQRLRKAEEKIREEAVRDAEKKSLEKGKKA